MGPASSPDGTVSPVAPPVAVDEDAAGDAGVDAGVDAGEDAGDGTLAAGADGGSAAAAPPPPLVEARGVWVTRWDFRTAADVERIVAEVAAAGFNQIYFQVRGAADAYYRSRLEPWAAPLAGKLGRDPGWDPLAEAIAAAKRHGLELHAWINLCTAWKGRVPPGRSEPRHILRTHPAWRVIDRNGKAMPYSDGNYVFMNPANPDFQKHLEGVVSEIASFYDIDGLHLDYARYPNRNTSFDRVSRRRFRKARKADRSLTRARWQREELTRLIGRLRQAARKVRPGLDVSAAVTGIYEDRWGWRDVTQGRIDFFQDSHRWAAEGVVDALIPMIYWKPTPKKGQRTDFATLVEDFKPLQGQVRLLAGINVEAGGWSVLVDELRIVRAHHLDGVVLFAYRALADRGWLVKLKEDLFSIPARARPAPADAGQGQDSPAPSLSAGTKAP